MPNIKHYNKSQNKASRDEFYSPKILVDLIIKYLPKNKIIWCPFDTKNSEFVINLKNSGFKVEYSHIADGQDFFNYQPQKWDIIVSNPPFTKKLDILKRCKNLGKPFALLMATNCLDYIIIQNFLRNELPDIQFLFQNRKISYNGKPASFNTSFWCWKLLKKQVIFEYLENNNTNKFHIPSMMEKDRNRIINYLKENR